MRKSYTIVLMLFLSVLGCDIPGKLVIENKSGNDAVYRCEFLKKDSISEFKIKGEKGNNKAGILFGFGHFWTDSTINKYVSSIYKIEILSTSDSIVLSNKEELYLFFKTRRKGVFKDEIKIIIR